MDNAKAILEWASSSALKDSHEAQFVISSLTDEVFMRDMRVTRQALRVLYILSIRLQYNAQSPWQAFLIIQRAVGLMEDVEEESEDAGQALAKELKLSMERRFPPEEGKLYAIYDFRILKNSDGSEQLHFPEELVEKSLKHHLSTFYRFYQRFGVFSLVLKILSRIHRHFCRAAHLRDLYDIFIVATTLTLEETDQKVLEIFVSILSSFSSDSAVAEWGFSALNRIRTKTRNRLCGDNLEAVMSMRLNPLPSSSDTVSPWKASKERRRRQVSRKPKRDNLHTVHEMSIAELNELDDEEYREDEQDIWDISWENLDEEISEGVCEGNILEDRDVKSIGNDCGYEDEPQPKRAKH